MITGLNHITLAVSDVTRALSFYRDVLGLTAHASWDGGAYLSAGSLWLCLSLDEVDEREDYTHIAFSVEKSDFMSLSARIRASGAKVWKDDTSEGQSLYFTDLDGHRLEIHLGDLQSRLESVRSHPYQGLRFY